MKATFITSAILIMILFVGCRNSEPPKPGATPAVNSKSPSTAPGSLPNPVTLNPSFPGPLSVSDGGGLDSGGGDPLAVQFLQIAQFFQTLHLSGEIELPGLKNDRVLLQIQKIEKSLEGKMPLVIFPIGETIDCFGAPKLGCVREGRISFARHGWIAAPLGEKIEVALMELLLSMGEKERYTKAPAIAEKMSSRLVLTDGHIRMPRSTDEVRKTVIEILNQKDNAVRKFILKGRADNCATLDHHCSLKQKARDENIYVFSDADVQATIDLGAGKDTDPCKSDDCDGENTDTRSFLISVDYGSASRWSRTPGALILEATYLRSMSQKTGALKYSTHLSVFRNDSEAAPQ